MLLAEGVSNKVNHFKSENGGIHLQVSKHVLVHRRNASDPNQKLLRLLAGLEPPSSTRPTPSSSGRTGPASGRR